MGPKFVIAFSGVELEGVSEFMQTIKNGLESLVITQNEQDYYEDEEPLEISPKINVVLTNYYKGTAIEGTTKKLEEYLNLAPEEESDINYI